MCKHALALPPYGKLTASSERMQLPQSQQPSPASRTASSSTASGTNAAGGAAASSFSCQAEDAYIVTKKAWCSKEDTGEFFDHSDWPVSTDRYRSRRQLERRVARNVRSSVTSSSAAIFSLAGGRTDRQTLTS